MVLYPLPDRHNWLQQQKEEENVSLHHGGKAEGVGSGSVTTLLDQEAER